MFLRPYQMRSFATKNDDAPPPKTAEELFEEQKMKKRGKVTAAAATGEEAPKPRKRRTKVEIEAEKIEKEIKASEKKTKKAAKGKKEVKMEPMYTLKFNSPILPYAKFPLTQNKYIQDFLRSYEEDKSKIDRVIGVHFEKNSNSNATDAVGIEIEIIKKNNITIIESNTNRRFRVQDYNSTTNFCNAIPYEDEDSIPLLKDPKESD